MAVKPVIFLFCFFLLCFSTFDTHQSEPQRNKDQEIISKQDIEKFITTAIVVGIQKFAATHPRTKEIFDNVTDVIKGAETKKKKAK